MRHGMHQAARNRRRPVRETLLGRGVTPQHLAVDRVEGGDQSRLGTEQLPAAVRALGRPVGSGRGLRVPPAEGGRCGPLLMVRRSGAGAVRSEQPGRGQCPARDKDESADGEGDAPERSALGASRGRRRLRVGGSGRGGGGGRSGGVVGLVGALSRNERLRVVRSRQRAQLPHQLVGRRPVLGLFGEAAGDERCEVAGHVGQVRLVVDDLVGDDVGAVGVEGATSRRRVHHHRAQGEDVCGRSHLPRTAELLRCHERRRSDQFARLGPQFTVRRP